ncbi:MAG: hypothetical protein ACOCSN_03555 [Halanaeroarchaeum sp.]
MGFDTVWHDIREAAEALGEDEVLVTPASERPVVVVRTDPDRIVIEYLETDERRVLRRGEFEVLYDRLHGKRAGLDLADLASGVEPYASVLTLSGHFGVDESGAEIVEVEDGGANEQSRFLRSAWAIRPEPERVHDDAILLADALERADLDGSDELGNMDETDLTDLYVLLSDVQRGADRLRRTIGDALLDRIGPDGHLHGQFGTVTRTRRERRHPLDDETVLSTLDAEGVPREWVLGVDPEKLEVVVAATDVEEESVYDVEVQTFVQKTAVESAEKQARLHGLLDRLARMETPEGEALRDEIERLETRLDDLLAAG